MRTLKIYTLPKKRSEELVALAYKLPMGARFKREGKLHGISIDEWRMFAGYRSSREFKQRQEETSY